MTHVIPAWMLGMRDVAPEQLDAPLTVLNGAVPDGLRGTFYRNGPAAHAPGGTRNNHWFDGDGMVQAFDFTDNGLHHHGRFVATQKHLSERAAGHRVLSAFDTPVAMTGPPGPNDTNPANTSVVPHHGRLLALCEAGSAFDLDPETLHTTGPMEWTPDGPGAPFSAHPCVEPDGTLWNFGMRQSTGEMVLYEIAPSGTLRRAEAIPLPDGVPLVHDFAVTQRRLVFLLPPFVFDGERWMAGHTTLGSHVWRPDEPMRALVVDKADWSRRQWFELPAGFTFHIGGAWDDGQAVRIDYERFPDTDILTRWARDIMTSSAAAATPGEATQVTLDLHSSTARQSCFATSSEFPVIHPKRVGLRYRYRYSVMSDGVHGHPFQNAVQRIDMETGVRQTYSFGPQAVTEEHVVVPKLAGVAEDDAWLVGTVLDLERGATRLTVFEAARVSDGPVLDASLPYALPLGFHGDFNAT